MRSTYDLVVRTPARVVAKEVVAPLLSVFTFIGLLLLSCAAGALVYNLLAQNSPSKIVRATAILLGTIVAAYTLLFLYEVLKTLHFQDGQRCGENPPGRQRL